MSECAECVNFNIMMPGCDKRNPIRIHTIWSYSHSVYKNCQDFKQIDNEIRSRP